MTSPPAPPAPAPGADPAAATTTVPPAAPAPAPAPGTDPAAATTKQVAWIGAGVGVFAAMLALLAAIIAGSMAADSAASEFQRSERRTVYAAVLVDSADLDRLNSEIALVMDRPPISVANADRLEEAWRESFHSFGHNAAMVDILGGPETVRVVAALRSIYEEESFTALDIGWAARDPDREQGQGKATVSDVVEELRQNKDVKSRLIREFKSSAREDLD